MVLRQLQQDILEVLVLRQHDALVVLRVRCGVASLWFCDHFSKPSLWFFTERLLQQDTFMVLVLSKMADFRAY